MRLRDIIAVTQARAFSPQIDLDREVAHAFASDLMSDVLCHEVTQGLLITGLNNPQMLRTADIADVAAILLVRGKEPQPETIRLAQELGIPLIGTKVIMFEACGRLYEAGLPACQWHDGNCPPDRQ
jgi:predicted transcriptional regulator